MPSFFLSHPCSFLHSSLPPPPSHLPSLPSLPSCFLSSLLHVQCTSSLPSHLPSLPPPPLPPAFRLLSSLLAPSCSSDNELPDYIMVMLANKKTFHQINNDLQLFLGSNTNHFTEWLQKATANPDTVVKKSGGNVYRLHEQYIHVHVLVHAGTHTCTCTCTHTRRTCTCTCTHIHAGTHTYIYMYMYKLRILYVCTCAHMYIYMYVCTCIYVHCR